MTERETQIITPRMIAGLVIVSALSLLAFLVLNAYAPELRSAESSEANALSKSAIGYAGLNILAEQSGAPVSLSRDPRPCGYCSLLVLTPEVFNDPAQLKKMVRSGARLIILPKWFAAEDPRHRGWAVKVGSMGTANIAKILSAVVNKAVISQREKSGQATLRAAADANRTRDLSTGPIAVDQLQTIAADGIEPVVQDEHKRTVLARIAGSQTYILSDPDLVNNFGLHDRARAILAYNLLRDLRVGDGPIVFDLTLNGFQRSPSILKAVFSPPFLAATLCAVLAAAFLAFHALNRFGSPQRTGRAIAFGKRALADNTAAVIKLLGREPAIAGRYAQAMLNLVGAQAGASREQMMEPRFLAALEMRAGSDFRFSDLRSQADQVHDKAELLRVAEKLFRWRQKVLHERR